MAAKDW